MRIQNLLRVIAVLCVIVPLWGCASMGGKYTSRAHPVARDHLAEIPDIPIPHTANDRVQAWLDYFQNRGKERFTLYLQRSGQYIPMMRRIIKQERLPEDLVYLSMIESGFNPHAYSRARAVGAWQFMYATGARYGLRVNEYMDERRDPEKSTVAAARHLKDLFDRYEDWYLAFASYNAGEGKINRAIRRYQTEDFWEMSKKGNRYLKPETKNYVPKMIAAAMIARNPQKYGFDNIVYDDPIEYDKVELASQTDLRVVAKSAGVTFNEIRNLNPELLLWVTPDQSNYEIKIPKGTRSLFQKNYASLEKWQCMGEKLHLVQEGENLDSIGTQYKFPTRYLAKVNNTDIKDKLKTGHNLTIPYAPPKIYKNALLAYQPIYYYRVRNGDTLGHIARRHGVSVSKIRHWNNDRLGKYIFPGQKLRIHQKGSSAWQDALAQKSTNTQKVKVAEKSKAPKTSITGVHKVKSGESLWIIARAYGMGVNDLKSLNEGKIDRYLKPGTELKINSTAKAKSEEPVVVAKKQPAKVGGSEHTHTVKSGESLWIIARAYDMSVADLEKMNEGKVGRYLKPGVQLKVSNEKKSTQLVKAKTDKGDVIYHSVNEGDSLWTISRHYNVSIKDLQTWNHGKIGRYLKPGSTLDIYPNQKKMAALSPKEEVAAPTIATVATDSVIYKVRSGDTLWDIAMKYKVSTNDLKKWNDIQKVKRLMPGDNIHIKAPKETAPLKEEA
jgi:membrane-bound lytic murein transglycosylase D